MGVVGHTYLDLVSFFLSGNFLKLTSLCYNDSLDPSPQSLTQRGAPRSSDSPVLKGMSSEI
jgi:hypothetical protein